MDPYLLFLHKKAPKLLVLLNSVTIIIVTVLIALIIALAIQTINNCETCNQVVETTTGYGYTVLSILFFVVGMMINRRLHKYFPSFYDENKKILWVACFGLSIPLLFRGIVDLLRAYDTKLFEFI